MNMKRRIGPCLLLASMLFCLTNPLQAAPPDNGNLVKTTLTPVAFTGGVASYSIAASNLGNNTIPNVEISDTLPAGFTYVAGTTMINGAPAADPAGLPEQPVWSIGNIQGASTVILAFEVLVDAATPLGVYYNSATATGRNGTYTFPATGPTAAVTVQPGAPLLTVLKSASPLAADPGAAVLYTISVSNTGTAPGANISVEDALGAASKLALDPFAAGSPFRFIEGASPSGLTLGSIAYSNDSGATYGYTPVDDGTGHDGAVSHFRIDMIGTIPASGPSSPSFSLQYEVSIR